MHFFFHKGILLHTSTSDPLHVHEDVWSCVWHYERCLLCVYVELCLIGIVGDVILLYNNEEKETSAAHENKRRVKRKRLTTHSYSIHSNTPSQTVSERFRKPMCFNVSSTGGQGWGERGSHDSPVCWMKLSSNQVGMIVLTRRAPTKSSSSCWETFQVKAVISHFKCKCSRKYFSQFMRHKGMFTLHITFYWLPCRHMLMWR